MWLGRAVAMDMARPCFDCGRGLAVLYLWAWLCLLCQIMCIESRFF